MKLCVNVYKESCRIEKMKPRIGSRGCIVSVLGFCGM